MHNDIDMNDTKNTNVDSFDLEDASKEEFEEFAEDVGEVIMQKILHKAWAELDSSKRDILTSLLESSEANPEDGAKQEEVFAFLDAHMTDLPEFVARELEAIQKTYSETRDQLRDAVV
ncbi:TPA: hypothetical protein DEP58_00880 [Patescibacteria group bacterium]|nr:hypothetical protein [Patescibacteria group bacterium]